MKYISTITDTMTGETLYTSRACSTWEEAQHKADAKDRTLTLGMRSRAKIAVRERDEAAATLGAKGGAKGGVKGGSVKSPAKAKASAANGAKGGRPKATWWRYGLYRAGSVCLGSKAPSLKGQFAASDLCHTQAEAKAECRRRGADWRFNRLED